MVVSEVFDHKGETLKFHQCVTAEEAKKENLPNGVYFFWMLGKRRIVNPMEVIQLVIQSSNSGHLNAPKLLNAESLNNHYKNLKEAQLAVIKKAMNQTKQSYNNAYANAGMPAHVVEEVNRTIDIQSKNLDQAGFPEMDGVTRPSRKQAEFLAGGKENIDRFLPKSLQKKIFGE